MELFPGTIGYGGNKECISPRELDMEDLLDGIGTLEIGNQSSLQHVPSCGGVSDVRYYLASSPGPIRSWCAYAGAPPCGKPQGESTKRQWTAINQSSSCITIIIILSDTIEFILFNLAFLLSSAWPLTACSVS
jgi:hypothetical protein